MRGSLERLRWVLLADVLLLTALGAFVRLIPLLASDFPVHDGGMFMAIIGDIRSHGMALPDHVSYNGGTIPFDYPPLAFWLAAWSPLDAITSLRLIPLVASTLTVPVFAAIVWEIRPERRVVFVATLVFTLVPHSWEWLVTGGGLTRAPGMLVAMVAIWQLLRTCAGERWVNAILCGVAGGLTVLLHPEATVFLAASGLLIVAARVRRRRQLGLVAIAGAVAFAVVLPWLAILLSGGRLLEALSAGGTGFEFSTTLTRLMTLQLTDEVAVPVALFLGAIGTLMLLRDRKWLVPAWIGVQLLIAARGAPTYAMVPLCIAAGVGFEDGVLRQILRLEPETRSWQRARAAGIVLMATWLVLNVPLAMALGRPPFSSLSTQAREGMAWVRANTAPDAVTIDLTDRMWAVDYVGEWAPALTGRVSLSTMQGYEWFGSSVWQPRLARVDELRKCVREDAGCVDAWLRANAAGRDVYVLVPDLPESSAILRSVASSPRFEVAWQKDDLLVARWVGP